MCRAAKFFSTPVSSLRWKTATDLYGQRPDMEWGLTDCVSFTLMRERNITQAVTADQHFVQAGFQALLTD